MAIEKNDYLSRNPQEIANLFSPDLDSGLKAGEKKRDHIPTVLKNIVNIIGVEAKRIFTAIAHPSAGLLSNEKILKYLASQKVNVGQIYKEILPKVSENTKLFKSIEQKVRTAFRAAVPPQDVALPRRDGKEILFGLSKLEKPQTIEQLHESLDRILYAVNDLADLESLDGVDTKKLFDAIDKWKNDSVDIFKRDIPALANEYRTADGNRPGPVIGAGTYSPRTEEEMSEWEEKNLAPIQHKMWEYTESQNALCETLAAMSDTLKDTPAMDDIRKKLVETAHNIDSVRVESNYRSAKNDLRGVAERCGELHAFKVEMNYAVPGVRRYLQFIEKFTEMPFVEKDDLSELVTILKDFETWNGKMTNEMKTQGAVLADKLSKATKNEDKRKIRQDILKLGLREKQAYQLLKECVEKLRIAASIPGVGARLKVQTNFINNRREEIEKIYTDLIQSTSRESAGAGQKYDAKASFNNAIDTFLSQKRADSVSGISRDLTLLKGAIKGYSRMFTVSEEQTEEMKAVIETWSKEVIPLLAKQRMEIRNGLKQDPNNAGLLKRKEELLKAENEISGVLLASHALLSSSGEEPNVVTQSLLKALGGVDAERASLRTGKTFKRPSLLKLSLGALLIGGAGILGTAFNATGRQGEGGVILAENQTLPSWNQTRNAMSPLPNAHGPAPSIELGTFTGDNWADTGESEPLWSRFSNFVTSYLYPEEAVTQTVEPTELPNICELFENDNVTIADFFPEVPEIVTEGMSPANITQRSNLSKTDTEGHIPFAPPRNESNISRDRIARGEQIPKAHGPSLTPTAAPPPTPVMKTQGSAREMLDKANMLNKVLRPGSIEITNAYKGVFEAAKEQLYSQNDAEKAEAQDVLLNFVKRRMFVDEILAIESPGIFPAWMEASKLYVHSPVQSGVTGGKMGALTGGAIVAASLLTGGAPSLLIIPVVSGAFSAFNYIEGAESHRRFGAAYDLAQRELASPSGRFDQDQLSQISEILNL